MRACLPGQWRPIECLAVRLDPERARETEHNGLAADPERQVGCGRDAGGTRNCHQTIGMTPARQVVGVGQSALSSAWKRAAWPTMRAGRSGGSICARARPRNSRQSQDKDQAESSWLHT